MPSLNRLKQRPCYADSFGSDSPTQTVKVWLSVSTYQQNFTVALLHALEWEISYLVVNHNCIEIPHPNS